MICRGRDGAEAGLLVCDVTPSLPLLLSLTYSLHIFAPEPEAAQLFCLSSLTLHCTDLESLLPLCR